MFEFDVRVGGGELPTDSCGAVIAAVGPPVATRWKMVLSGMRRFRH